MTTNGLPGQRAQRALANERELDRILLQRERSLTAVEREGLTPRGIHRMPAHPKRRARVRNTTGFDGDVGYAFPAWRSNAHGSSRVVSYKDGKATEFKPAQRERAAKNVHPYNFECQCKHCLRESARLDRVEARQLKLRLLTAAGITGNID